MKAFTTMNTSAYTDTSSAILDEFFGGGGEFQQVRKKALRRAGRSPVKKASLKSLHASSNEQLLDGGESTCSFVSKKASAQGQNKIEAKRERRPLPKKTQKSLKDLHIEDNNVVSDLIHRVTHLSGSECVLPLDCTIFLCLFNEIHGCRTGARGAAGIDNSR